MNPNGFQTVLNDRSASVHRRSRPRSRRACECGVAVATAEGELCFLLFVITFFHNFAFNHGFNRDLVTGNLDR